MYIRRNLWYTFVWSPVRGFGQGSSNGYK